MCNPILGLETEKARYYPARGQTGFHMISLETNGNLNHGYKL
jgi:hypothetical protein